MRILKLILLESATADLAHKLGLEYEGHGYWSLNGVTVAKTENGRLLKLSKKDRADIAKKKYGDDNEKEKTIHDPYNVGKYDNVPKGLHYTGEQNPNVLEFSDDVPSQVPDGLNGIALMPWDDAPNLPQKTKPSWEDENDPKKILKWKGVQGINPNLDEPEMPKISGKKQSAGMIIIEPDGRAWIVEPTDHFMGVFHTFPKGGKDDGLTLQETAIKEAYEETGLHAEIIDYIGDTSRSSSVNRYYLGRRVDGSPLDHGWESESVKLVPLEELADYFNVGSDLSVAKYLTENKEKLLNVLQGKDKLAPEGILPEIDMSKEFQGNLGSMHNILGKKLGGQKGSNDGGFFEGHDGIKRYVKNYKDPARTFGEVLANELYTELGIGAPKSEYFQLSSKDKTKPSRVAFASEIVENNGTLGGPPNKEFAHKILDGFLADILVANWDTVGLVYDNIVIGKDGNPYRIDQGGSFLSRAMETSGNKPEHLLNQITEWDAFANPSINKTYSSIFKAAGYSKPEDMGRERLTEQMKKILTIPAKYGSWQRFVDQKIKHCDVQTRDRMVEMLSERTQLLMQKIKSIPN